MTTSVKARTARKSHFCESCQWTPSLRGEQTIAPGHRYLLHTAFPGDESNGSDQPWSLKECIACAETAGRWEHSRGLGSACAAWCCGDVPCARIVRHDGDHSCRRCFVADETAPGRVAA